MVNRQVCSQINTTFNNKETLVTLESWKSTRYVVESYQMQCTMGPIQIKKFGCLSNVNKQLSPLCCIILCMMKIMEVMTRECLSQDFRLFSKKFCCCDNDRKLDGLFLCGHNVPMTFLKRSWLFSRITKYQWEYKFSIQDDPFKNKHQIWEC